jgi:hypothetical protein
LSSRLFVYLFNRQELGVPGIQMYPQVLPGKKAKPTTISDWVPKKDKAIFKSVACL